LFVPKHVFYPRILLPWFPGWGLNRGSDSSAQVLSQSDRLYLWGSFLPDGQDSEEAGATVDKGSYGYVEGKDLPHPIGIPQKR
jgi:hypothetical protein